MEERQSKPRAILIRAVGLVLVPALSCSAEHEPRPATCADFEGQIERPGVPLTFSTEHLDIHVDDGRIMCAGTPGEYERFYQYVADELSIELTRRVPVYVMSPQGYCPAGIPGCRKQDGTVIASPGTTMHELTHATSCEWRFTSAEPWSEGLAVAFDVTPLAAKTDPREFITVPDTEPFFNYYSRAGHFVRWLLKQRGPEPFREVYRRSPLAGGEAVLDMLADVYGEDTESLFAEYQASAPDLWVPHRQCADLPVLTPSAGVWEFEATFDCDDPATFGPYERYGRLTNQHPGASTAMYQSFLVEIETAGTYRVERDEVETAIQFERCLDHPGLTQEQAQNLWYREILVPTLQGETEIDLTPGTYRVDVLREFGPPHPVWLRIEPPPG